MTEIRITRAGEPEFAACLALLPRMAGMPAEFLVARLDGRLAGVAAVLWRSWADPNGFPLAVEVTPAARRRGVGRRLVDAARDLVQGETPGLWSFASHDLDGPVAAFLAACGFEPSKRRRMFQLGMRDVLNTIEPLLERLRARGHAPEAPRIIPLREAPLGKIAWMMSESFGGGPIGARASLEQRIDDPQLNANDRSLALMIDDLPAAVLLLHRQEDIGVVDNRLVAPRWRRSWPSALLLAEGLRRGLAEGVELVRFTSEETSTDTMMLAARQGAETVDEQAFYYASAG